ncbi:hypothetical protein COCMIDRAFT_30788 [Bipolaris oryzae ATCC 44560]|uniref:Uncharacterized protein n=1 Tax=Bipolaris oryzae ATCC 44560 TaxID=930090 RepID=W6YXH2_COCMI|nr:uncharacterized protein COCMIDRAFT_30788 [Bipolaris oryzae ATCC 44560]EUC40234.1 hypothetical protein COCMIDRAFT_30788 [Bipolaris oryzae ATCC 44560]
MLTIASAQVVSSKALNGMNSITIAEHSLIYQAALLQLVPAVSSVPLDTGYVKKRWSNNRSCRTTCAACIVGCWATNPAGSIARENCDTRCENRKRACYLSPAVVEPFAIIDGSSTTPDPDDYPECDG